MHIISPLYKIVNKLYTVTDVSGSLPDGRKAILLDEKIPSNHTISRHVRRCF